MGNEEIMRSAAGEVRGEVASCLTSGESRDMEWRRVIIFSAMPVSRGKHHYTALPPAPN